VTSLRVSAFTVAGTPGLAATWLPSTRVTSPFYRLAFRHIPQRDVAAKNRYQHGASLCWIASWRVLENASDRPASIIVCSRGLDPRQLETAFARRGRCSASSRSQARLQPGRVEMFHMMRKRQARYAYNPDPSIAGQFESLPRRQALGASFCAGTEICNGAEKLATATISRGSPSGKHSRRETANSRLDFRIKIDAAIPRQRQRNASSM
jgi:hypothetical protein